jgi:hypothetical protein
LRADLEGATELDILNQLKIVFDAAWTEVGVEFKLPLFRDTVLLSPW